MSGLEIERKFLVHKRMDWKSLASSCSHIQQGYFAAVNTVRVRLSRYEFEKEISCQEAQQLMALCEPGVIDKYRYLIEYAGHTFEVDEFHGDNEGLVMAEVELKREDEAFEKPDFIGKEVTGDRRFYNSHMRRAPFILWCNTLPEEYR